MNTIEYEIAMARIVDLHRQAERDRPARAVLRARAHTGQHTRSAVRRMAAALAAQASALLAGVSWMSCS